MTQVHRVESGLQWADSTARALFLNGLPRTIMNVKTAFICGFQL
jgi:hypothetical protein